MASWASETKGAGGSGKAATVLTEGLRAVSTGGLGPQEHGLLEWVRLLPLPVELLLTGCLEC